MMLAQPRSATHAGFMKRYAWIVSLFVLLPAAELALLLYVGQFLGVWPTLGLILVTGIIGSRLALNQGLAVWIRLSEEMARGQLPGQVLLDGVIILISGALLVTPGVITDLAGFAGLLPFTRAPMRNWVIHLFKNRIVRATPQDPASWQGAPRERPHYTHDLEDRPRDYPTK